MATCTKLFFWSTKYTAFTFIYERLGIDLSPWLSCWLSSSTWIIIYRLNIYLFIPGLSLASPPQLQKAGGRPSAKIYLLFAVQRDGQAALA